MQISNESQCYFVQLQIDDFLDGELAVAQQDAFMGHVQTCEACARELQFARNLHDAVMDLPILDCAEQVLLPAQELAASTSIPQADVASAADRFWQPIRDWLGATPLTFRLAVPALVLVVTVLTMGDNLFQSQPQLPNQQAGNESVESYSAEEIQQALQDLNLAIDYLNDVSQRTEVMIGERFVVTPLQESLNASFDRVRSNRRNEGSREI